MLTPKNQLADILTKGSFSRDEWNDFLRLFNIMSFSLFSAVFFFSLKTEYHVEESSGVKDRRRTKNLVAKSKPACLLARNLSSKQSPSLDSGASCSLGNQDWVFSTPFSTLAPSPTTSPSLLYPSASPSTATLQGGFCLGRLAEQSLLTKSEQACSPCSCSAVASTRRKSVVTFFFFWSPFWSDAR